MTHPADPPAPRPVPQVMVSSTYTDLKEHRAALIEAINAQGLHPRVMAHDSAGLADVIDSSLQMVRDSAAYILIVSRKYGQTPECPRRNPQACSITELEYDEAVRLGRPVLLFVMGEDHPVKERDIELDPDRRAKLTALRARAKQSAPDSRVHRVYAAFDSLADFKDKLAAPLARLREHLASARPGPEPTRAPAAPGPMQPAIPLPPDLYAEPPYIGRDQFVGRQAELEALNDWAQAADPHNLLLFDAIGGNGKSMLTWHWVNRHATRVRGDWAGRFWYSFYERGAVMADFCRRALTYITRRPLAELNKLPTRELARDLLAELHARPWLLVLDGLERVLVAYHRIDAAEVPDEEANAPTDKVLSRNPRATIRDEDGDLLRALAVARPSKVLVSSRLVPQVLLNPAGQPIPGVRRLPLPGLRPLDAEALFRACGVTGDAQAIRDYLTRHCDNHPLVIGVLAGLVLDYLPDRGNFDAWCADLSPLGGARLDLGRLDLIQSRNHILKNAIAALPEHGRQLLSTLALVSESVDHATLAALNPHLPPEPEEVEVPEAPESQWNWMIMNRKQKAQAKQDYESALARRADYERALADWRASPAVRDAPARLAETVRDLERRGLLQYAPRGRRYDLHPVVRAVVAGAMAPEDQASLGQRVVDHFSSMAHSPYEQATSLGDLAPGLHVVRTLLRLGRINEAASAYNTDLPQGLLHNLEAHTEALALLRPFFPSGWGELPSGLDAADASLLVSYAGVTLLACGETANAGLAFGGRVAADLGRESWAEATASVMSVSKTLVHRNWLGSAHRLALLAIKLAHPSGDKAQLFLGRLLLFRIEARLGRSAESGRTWGLLDPMGRNWTRNLYRQGEAEQSFAESQLWQGTLAEHHLTSAAELASAADLAARDNNRQTFRDIHRLRGEWRLEQGDWGPAADAFHEAVRMARERQLTDPTAETGLALAKLHLDRFPDTESARQEAERLSAQREPAHRTLAHLWHTLGDQTQASHHALAAYRWAWGQGEPWVFRYELDQAAQLLRELQVPIPDLPPYDPAADPPFPWEAKVRAAIERLRA